MEEFPDLDWQLDSNNRALVPGWRLGGVGCKGVISCFYHYLNTCRPRNTSEHLLWMVRNTSLAILTVAGSILSGF